MSKGKCHRCGQCCTSASVALDNVPWGRDQMELGKWLELHGCRVEPRMTINGQVLGVRFPVTCKHLIYDKKGLAVCQDYDNRPEICKQYWCHRVK